MTATPPLTPPQPTSDLTTPHVQQPSARPGRGIAIGLGIAGAIVLVGTLGVTVVNTLLRASAGEAASSYVAETTGVTALDLGVSSASLEVRFADVDEARLEVGDDEHEPRQRWDMVVRGSTLVVSQPATFDWLGFSWWDQDQAVLTLPQSLAGDTDLRLDNSAGSTTIDGDFRAVSLDISAGFVSFSGESTSLEVSVSAGEAQAETAGAREVRVDVSAGKAVVAVSGTSPKVSDVEVSAGRAELLLPDGSYAVSQQTSAGSADVSVRTDPGSANTVAVRVSAGSALVGYSD